ncbi:MAG TPA: His/Gly/Thr/Pro-type tRNA ligase C-terminal domain-containing protein, partial [Candidatus Saccharibacteria bacterium]|nr:His/Gly/Thr/Pro-type tRNA ligase C-terminal domain-containing protein [Candidatus Saccharibacteria bacterium]
GGRYDGLVGLFGAEPISAVGMAPGGTMIENFLTVHDLVPVSRSTTELYIIVMGEVARGASKLAQDLREAGLNVELDITDRKLDKQIKTAVKKRIPYILFVGESEIETEIYTLKDATSEDEQKLTFDQVVDTVKIR